MKIATWNVNSIKARTTHTQRWLERVSPDILCLQELKGLEFPHEAFDGWQVQTVGQKAYNGVAIISKNPVEVILDKLPGDEADEQARYLEVQANGIRIVNIYLPNGNPAPGDKFDYKLKWMHRLYERLSELRRQETDFVVAGDFNVIPESKDCWDPKIWKDDALFRIETRRAWRALLNLGLTDAFRALNQNTHQYTFWDYQAGCWQKDHGIRIDHFLLSPKITDRLQSCTIDKEPRGEESPSDHTPVILTLKA
ncbi:MAG: exodeoxyribonuclease III [Micavibrio aeruginosavorus]|uniref:Exodeoxyribonuclease III n=1 Tax=Micavibrio aeruginosavorus TaxID=349221 RepID=A0A2W5PM83_9BACT|nr:MAG: exodeoxyribonuclease III [Micavibrio aeruginosavorus]